MLLAYLARAHIRRLPSTQDRDNAEVVGIVTRKNLAHLSEHDGRPAEDTTPTSHELAQL